MDYWLGNNDFKNILNMVYRLIDVIRIVVPIGLIVMTTLDISKKVINPEDKDGQKKIMIRAIAALIVFLFPTLLRIVLRLANVDTIDDNIGSNGNSNVVLYPTPTITTRPIPTVDPNTHLSGLSLIDCPSSTKKFHKNDIITLDTDISSSYTGDIKWSINAGEKYVKLYQSKGGKTAQINVLDVPKNTTAVIVVEADRKKASCSINLENDTLSSVNITNCPNENHLIGEKIKLETDIPSSFSGTIKWSVDDEKVAKLTESSDKKSVTAELLSRPMGGTVFITVLASGVAKTCHINIKAVPVLEINNCPSNLTFNVGDKITFTTNLPSNYNGPIEWTISSLDKDDFKITVSNSKREAVVEVLKVPQLNRGTVIVAADNESTRCQINVS